MTQLLNGIPALAAGVVILVGIFGNAFGPSILGLFRIKSKEAVGTTLGTASHGIGTAKAFEDSELMGVYSGLALCVNGVITAIVCPFILKGTDMLSFIN